MTSPPLLLFLQLEGVMLAQGPSRQTHVASAIRTVARQAARWGDYSELWDTLVAREALTQLEALDRDFEPTYCLSSSWTAWMDRTTAMQVLRRAGLGFVAENLHARWETGSSLQPPKHQTPIDSWLDLNPEHRVHWAAILSENHAHANATQDGTSLPNVVACMPDVGLTEFEIDQLRKFLRTQR